MSGVRLEGRDLRAVSYACLSLCLLGRWAADVQAPFPTVDGAGVRPWRNDSRCTTLALCVGA